MENGQEEEDIENNGTYKFLRDLSLPAEPLVEEAPFKRRKVDNQNWHQIDGFSATEYFDLDSGENLTEPEHSALNETTSTSETGYESQRMRQCLVASAVWDVIDPQGSVRGLSVSIPEAPVFSTGLVSPVVEERPQPPPHKKIRYSKFVMYPPHSGSVPRPQVDRPLGCKTITLAGLPSKMKDDYIKEIFRDCGKLNRLRRKAPDDIHITFSCESSVDKALQFNGYTVVIKDRHRTPHSGRIHVDFVPVWREQQEYDQRAQAIQKEFYSNNNNVTGSSRSDSNFSEAALVKLVEGLYDESTFNDGINQIVRWMEEGRCHKRNAFHFFSVLQALQSLVSRLMKDTAKLEEEVRDHRSRLSSKYTANSINFAEILKTFNVASTRFVWDQFTDNQKNRIDMWKKHIKEINESNSRDMVSERKSSPTNGDGSAESGELVRLQKENERLKKELKVAQRGNQGEKNSSSIKTENCNNHQEISNHVDGGVRIVDKEACLIAAIGAFLNFHRFGESIECICKYLLNIDSSVTTRDIEHLMRKFPTVFKEETVKDDVGSERKWTVMGF